MTGHVTRSSLFGLNNVKTRDELKAVGSFKKKKRESDDWGLDANDALFVPILASSRETHISNLKGYGSENRFTVRQENPYGIHSAPEYKKEASHSNSSCSNTRKSRVQSIQQGAVSEFVEADICLQKTRVGIYSTSAEYCQIVERQFKACDFECNYFGLSKSLGPQKLKQALSIDLWVVNLNDEDENEALNTIMDICVERTALFLVESMPTSQCLSKLHQFLEAA